MVSHGWSHGDLGSRLLDYFSWTGTMDPSAYLAVPAAIEFQRDNDWPRCALPAMPLALETRDRIQALTGLPPVCSRRLIAGSSRCSRRACRRSIAAELRNRLWSEYKVEVPISGYHDDPLIRVSIQAYNTPEQVDRLIDALEALL